MEIGESVPCARPSRFSLGARQWLVLIVLLGAVLRFVPIWFGLPFDEARPDEETAIGHALAITGGDLNPHFYDWPSFTFYLFAACFSVAAWVQSLVDVHGLLTANHYFIIGRAIVAFAGTLTIVVLFRLTSELAGEITALVASFFLAVATLHVRESHFAMTDVLMTLLVLVSLTLILQASRAAPHGVQEWPRATRGFAAAGFVAGLATSTKYSAAATIAAAAAAQSVLAWRSGAEGWRWRAWVPSGGFAITFGFGFLLATPYAVLDYHTFAAGLSGVFSHLAHGHGANVGAGWIYHLRQSLPAGVSWPIYAAAIVGIVPLVKRDPGPAFIVGAFCLALYGVLGTGHTVFFRYVLPLVPPICLSAAVAATWAGERLAKRTTLTHAVAVGVVAAGIGISALANSVWFDVLLAKTDTRVLAGRWLAEHVQPDESLYDAGGTYAQASLAGVRVHAWNIDAFDAASSSFRNADGRIPDWLVLPQSPLIYTDVPPELRQLASDRYELANLVPATSESDKGIYDPQDAFFLPISRFGAILRPGPTLRIYRRRPQPTG